MTLGAKWRGTSRVLHVPYTYFPDPAGGTEIYVAGLAKRLNDLGFPSTVAAPGGAATYEYKGLAVRRFATTSRPSLGQVWGAPDEVAVAEFTPILDEFKPVIVHLHARTSAVSSPLLDLARARGIRTVVTYHTPTMSCVRGSMMYRGERPCDGKVLLRRCTACLAQSLGAPGPAAAALSWAPAALGRAEWVPKPLRLAGLVDEFQAGFERMIAKADQVVAVCNWVAAALAINGVPASKVTLCRQGLETQASPPARRPREGPLKLAYFGRLDAVKGIDRLIAGLALIPQAALQLDIYGIESDARFGRNLRSAAAGDFRIAFHEPLPAERVVEHMSNYDALVVPSLCLETGPLVVLEAFGAGLPVIGANRGGVAELVRNGVDGVLVDSDAPTAWASVLESLDRERLDALSSAITAPRTMDAVAAEMAALYTRLLSDRRNAA